MAQEHNDRFEQIKRLLQEGGFSLSPSKEDGIYDVARDGRYLCQVSAEELIYDERVNADTTTQAAFDEVIRIVHSV